MGISKKVILSIMILSIALGVNKGWSVEFKVDKAHSQVGFSVKHIVGDVHGQFKDFESTFTFDSKHPKKSAGTFVIQAASVDTNNDKRDGHLKTADFFDVANHPTITIDNATLAPAGKKNKYKLTGDLSMRGISKKVVFDVVYIGSGKNPWSGGSVLGFTAKTKIHRKDWGIVWNKSLDNGGWLVGEDVTIELQIEANEVKEEPKAEEKKEAKPEEKKP